MQKREKMNGASRAHELQSPVSQVAVCGQSAPQVPVCPSGAASGCPGCAAGGLCPWELYQDNHCSQPYLPNQTHFETSLILCVRLWQISGKVWAGGSGCF